MRSSIALVALVLAVAGLAAAQAPGFWVVVPQAGRDVWIPVDPTGRPAVPPGTPGVPAIPGVPTIPAVPALPSMAAAPPLGGELLVLRFDVVPGDIAIVIDGVGLDPSLRRHGVALAPGRHVIEFVRPGAPSVQMSLDAPRPAAPGSGYHVVPRP